MKKLFVFNIERGQGGYILITALLTLVIMSFVIMVVAQGLINNTRFLTFEQKSTQALDIAEAGINYYLWHLEHNPDDFRDGTSGGSSPYGPFTHNYYDANGKLLGNYALTITLPSNTQCSDNATSSSISSNFNSTSVPAGRYIWFNANARVNGANDGSQLTVSNSAVDITDGSYHVSVPIPDSLISFSSSASQATTTWNSSAGRWETTVPTSYSGNVFIGGAAWQVPSGVDPNSANPVVWTSSFSSNTNGLSLSWKYGAAVYPSVGSYDQLGVKPVDGSSYNQYNNSDAAGTPESIKTQVLAGGRGGGGSNYTGGWSGTGSATVTFCPSATGSTIVTVQSVGKTADGANTRTVVAKLGQPSLAKYLFLSDVGMVFSPTATTTGTVMSNGCIEFDGTNNGPVQSAMASCGGSGGVYGSGGPSSLWQYPVPSVDFNSVTANLAQMKTDAQNGGLYLSGSGQKGYYLYLNTNNTVGVYKVTSTTISNNAMTAIAKSFVANYTIPANGIIFCNDNIWVGGTGFNKHVTIAAATLPESSSTYRKIYLDANLTYAAYDGSAAIGLVAQDDIQIPSYAPSTMQVDAAILSQYGSVGYDTANGAPKTQFTLNGGISQRQNDFGFKVYGCGSVCHGFYTTIYNYDTNLLYGPPPDWPTTGIYSIISWREQ